MVEEDLCFDGVRSLAGRRMFPSLEFKVFGLKPEATYNMYVDMVLVDVNHWKFNSGKWVPSGQAEQSQKTSKASFETGEIPATSFQGHLYLHPDSPNSGLHWMNNEKVSFSKIKLTNNKQLSSSHSQNQVGCHAPPLSRGCCDDPRNASR